MSDPVARYLAMRDAGQPAPAPDTPDPENSYGMRLATHVLNTAQGIPGMEAFQAFMGMLGSHVPGNVPQTYGESLQNLRSMTGNIPPAESFAEHVAGSLPLASTKMVGGLPGLVKSVAGPSLLAASPALAGVELGAADQALAAGPESPRQRLENTAVGGLLGGAAGGLAHGITGAGGMVARYFKPEIGVRAAARGLLEPADVEAMRVANEIAPGGVSVATAAVPKTGTESSRFLPMTRLTAGSPSAGMLSEHAVLGQQSALDAAEKRLGDQMNQIKGETPLTPDLQRGLASAKSLLGAKHGMVPTNETGSAADIQSVRDVLSRLRFAMRRLENQGPDAPGVTTRDYGQAIRDITSGLYEHNPEFANLDRQYRIVMDQQRAASDVLETIQKARANQGGVSASGKEAESLGASLHGHPTFYMHFRNLITNPSGTADAVRRLVVQPGGPELMANLLKPPVTTPADLARYSLLAANPLVPHP